MAINFPNSPTVGDRVTVNNVTREWNGTAWISIASVVVGPTGATGPQGPQGEPGAIENISASSPITYASNTIGLDYDALVIDGGTA